MKKFIALLSLCMTTVSLANVNGFICKGSNLYATGKGYLTEFDSSSECQSAVYYSKNGFICKGSNLYATGKGYLTEFDSSSECQSAVYYSK